MRKVLISLLLASAAASPAIAGPRDWSDRQQAREDHQSAQQDRQAAREERQQARSDARVERQDARPERFNAPQQSFGGGGAEHVNVQGGRFNGYPQGYSGGAAVEQMNVRHERGNFNAGAVEQMNAHRERGNFGGGYQGNVDAYTAPGPKMVRPDNWREQRVNARELRQSDRPLPNVMRTRNPLIVSNVPRPGTQPPLRVENRRTPEVQWSTSWRHNDRYDWQNYRRHHRSIFHLGFYYDPYGWGYQPFSIGWRLWPSYYSQNYWINDPWMYRLPYAPPGYVWVRYWNDALLVDTWSGTVVDAIPGFFW